MDLGANEDRQIKRLRKRVRGLKAAIASGRIRAKRTRDSNVKAVCDFVSTVGTTARVRIATRTKCIIRRGGRDKGAVKQSVRRVVQVGIAVYQRHVKTKQHIFRVPPERTLQLMSERFSGGIKSLAHSYDLASSVVRSELKVAASFVLECDLKLVTNLTLWLREKKHVYHWRWHHVRTMRPRTRYIFVWA